MSLLHWQFLDKLHRTLNPLLQLAVILNTIGNDHHPPLHRFSGDVEGNHELFLQRLLTVSGTKPNNQEFLPYTNEYVAVQ